MLESKKTNVETIGLGAGSYPEPQEQKTKTIRGKVYFTFKFEMEVPEYWSRQDIIDDIEENYREYMQDLDEVDFS